MPPPMPVDLGTCRAVKPYGQMSPRVMSSVAVSQVSVMANISNSYSTIISEISSVFFLTDLALNSPIVSDCKNLSVNLIDFSHQS